MSSEAPARSRRAYHSPLRREQGERTERRIVDAAAGLLVAKGWSGMTMTDVAKAAGVSSAMLYKVFRTKAELIKRVYDVALVGDQANVPFRERPEFRAVVEDTDPASKLAGYTHLIRVVAERVLPIYAQLRAAYVVGDGDLRAVAETADAERLFGARGIVRDLLANGATLRPELDPDAATDLVWMAMSPEFWGLLVNGRGWAWDRAEHWVAHHLRTALLDDAARADVAGPGSS